MPLDPDAGPAPLSEEFASTAADERVARAAAEDADDTRDRLRGLADALRSLAERRAFAGQQEDAERLRRSAARLDAFAADPQHDDPSSLRALLEIYGMGGAASPELELGDSDHDDDHLSFAEVAELLLDGREALEEMMIHDREDMASTLLGAPDGSPGVAPGPGYIEAPVDGGQELAPQIALG